MIEWEKRVLQTAVRESNYIRFTSKGFDQLGKRLAESLILNSQLWKKIGEDTEVEINGL